MNEPLYIACECLQCPYKSETRKEIKRHIWETHNKFPQRKDYKISKESVVAITLNYRERFTNWLNKKKTKNAQDENSNPLRGTRKWLG